MKKLKILLLILLFSAPALAQDLPILTPEGFEEYKLGSAPPAESLFPGLTTKVVMTEKWEEGDLYKETWLKFFLNGSYLGKGLLNQEGVLSEIIIVDSKVAYEGGFRVGSTWDEIQRVFPGPRLYYTYVTERLFADSQYQPGVQVDFSIGDYVGESDLNGEFQSVEEDDLKSTARARSIRIY